MPSPADAERRFPAYGPRACRLLRDMTLPELAERTGYSVGYLRALERNYERCVAGERGIPLCPPWHTAQRISRALDVPVDAFMIVPPGTKNRLRARGEAQDASPSRRRDARNAPAAAPPGTGRKQKAPKKAAPPTGEAE